MAASAERVKRRKLALIANVTKRKEKNVGEAARREHEEKKGGIPVVMSMKMFLCAYLHCIPAGDSRKGKVPARGSRCTAQKRYVSGVPP